jgi:hypothetical protein
VHFLFLEWICGLITEARSSLASPRRAACAPAFGARPNIANSLYGRRPNSDIFSVAAINETDAQYEAPRTFAVSQSMH